MPVFDTTPYGRACHQCVKAKAKCTLRAGACDRCLRLKKDCQPAVGARRKPGRQPAASRVDALEARLDSIVNLLGTVPGLDGADRVGMGSRTVQPLVQEQPHNTRPLRQSMPPRHRLSATNTCSIDFRSRRITYSPHEVYMKRTGSQQAFAGTMACDPAPAHTAPDYHTQERQQPPAQADTQDQPHDGPSSPAAAGLLGNFPGLSTRAAEDALHRFRLRMVKCFPFVHIPEARVSAYRLRQTRPLLWLSVMACAAHAADLQDRLSLRLRQEIAEQAIVQHQRSLDLLLGIVGFLGWGMYYRKRDPFMLMYCRIATTMLQDLGLTEAPAPQPQPGANAHVRTCCRTHGFAAQLLASPVRTMEERRAVLGTYLIAVLVARFHRTPVALPWTDHMDECLRVLDAEPETPLDRLLVYQCRLQRIALDIPGPQAYAAFSGMLRGVQVQALVARQRDVEAQMPPFADEPDLHDICRLANVANEAAIYGVALYATHVSAEERARCGPDVERAGLLHTCLRLHRTYFDMAFGRRSTASGRDSFVDTFSFQTLTHISYFLAAVYRLASFGRDDPGCGWDTDGARAQLDLPHVVATLAQRFREAATHFSASTSPPASEDEGGFFSRAARSLDMLRTAWMATGANDNETADANEDGQTRADAVCMPAVDVTEQSLIGVDDLFSIRGTTSAWWLDMFSDGR